MADTLITHLGRTPGRRQWIASRMLARLGTKLRTPDPPYRWGYGNVESRMNVFHLASQTCAYGVPGDLVEIGCATGESSVVIQSVLTGSADAGKRFHVYDSFIGLPTPTLGDAAYGIHPLGDAVAPPEQFEATFRQAGVTVLPLMHRGWFEETIPAQLPERISFALVDCDLHASTAHVLAPIYARMSSGAIAMFGAYYDPMMHWRDGISTHYVSPGVQRATDEFFADKPERLCVLYANGYSNGYFRKI